MKNWGQELSGMRDWKFGGKSSFEGLCTYMCAHANGSKPNILFIEDYFRAVGEDPADYIDNHTKEDEFEAWREEQLKIEKEEE